MVNQIKILVVDDEEIVRKRLYENLEAKGYKVDTVEDGTKALKKIKKTPYNIILVDLVMPGKIDGLKLLKEIKKKASETIKIIITGYGTIESANEAMRMGVSCYLEKPINFDNLVEIIKKEVKEHPELIKKVRMKSEDLIYERHKKKLENEYQRGEFVAISFDTEEVIVGKDDLEVLTKAVKKFGKGNFIFKRIGYDYVYAIGGE